MRQSQSLALVLMVAVVVSVVTTLAYQRWLSSPAGPATATSAAGRPSPIAASDDDSGVHPDAAVALEPRVDVSTGASAGTAGFDAEVRVVDENGARMQPDGSRIQILMYSDADASSCVVTTRTSTWSGRLPMREFRILGVEEDGFPHALLDAVVLSPELPRVEVRLVERHDWSLEVVDARTGEPLRSFDLLVPTAQGTEAISTFQRFRDAPDPQVTRPLLTAVASPALVAETQNSGFYWVLAAGYCPASFVRNVRQRDARVELRRAGDLTVLVASASDVRGMPTDIERGAAPFELRLSSEHFAQRTWNLAGGEHIELNGIPAEDYEAELRLGSLLRRGLLVRRERVIVPPGGTAQLQLALELPALASNATTFAVTAVLPSEREDRGAWSLSLWAAREDGGWSYTSRSKLDSWEMLDSGSVFGNTFVGVDPGRYMLQLDPIGLRKVIDAVAGQREELLFDASVTAEVEVGVDGQRDGLGSLSVYWGFRDRPMRECHLEELEADSRSVAFRCVAQPIWLQIVGEDASSQVLFFAPEPGTVTRVAPKLDALTTRVRVTAWRGNGHAVVDSSFWESVVVEPLEHDGYERGKWFGRDGTMANLTPNIAYPDWSQCVIVLSKPGKYELRWPSAATSGTRRLPFLAQAQPTELVVPLD
ncbi:MAG: hypothetical protein IT454_05630 [Planctomycetes bacterium]|nr:hypothetical protein [Planctomycetota bacterium]